MVDVMYYTDSDGYVVHVGDVVQYTEYFEESEKYYCILALPNLGDMVEMTEIKDMSFDSTTMEAKYTIVNPKDVISVEPWKIGAI